MYLILPFTVAIFCVNDTTRIGVDVLVVGRYSDGNGLLGNCSLHCVCLMEEALYPSVVLDGDFGGLGGLVKAVG